MQFDYHKFENFDGRVVHRPYIPISVAYKGRKMSFLCLVDTGADKTIMPLEIAEELRIPLDLDAGEEINGAGGGTFTVYESVEPLVLSIIPPSGFTPIQWRCPVSFTKVQPTPLLGHKGCLERLNLKFCGREKALEITEC